MSKHTAGPWKVEKELSSRSSEWLIAMDCGDRGRGIAIAETVPATGREFANARLIAAAPELLDALVGLVAIAADSTGVAGYHLNGTIAEWDEFEEVTAAIKAIAKARGEKDE